MVWGTPCPPLWGSLPSKLSLREGSEHPIPSDEGFYGPVLAVKGPQAASRPVTAAGRSSGRLIRGDVFLGLLFTQITSSDQSHGIPS